MKNGLLIGCHQDLKRADLNYIYKIFDNFSKKYNENNQNKI